MFVAGITKVRNESEIIQDTLDHYAQWCDKIWVYDDASTDNTVEICKAHPVVAWVIEGKKLDPDRQRAEQRNRQRVLKAAQGADPDWVIYFDADERIEMPEFDWEKYDGVKMKLFDFYITEEDVDKRYDERRWMGPEYREILMMFKNNPALRYQHRDQREMVLRGGRVLKAGYVKHYGKAISVEEWEKTCDYYAEWPEPYATKWKNRRGKAVHSKSDWDRTLILWDEKDLYGRRL
jgi:glycosyltransferase involved in cell wall biosynthesis